jgi:hypothetical protein
MLIETPYVSGDVVSIKMIGGDEVVARLELETADKITLNKPLVVMMAQQGFGLAPFILTANPDTKLNIKPSAVICITKTFDPVAKQYIKQTSGLIT